jgi:hypothetical protein
MARQAWSSQMYQSCMVKNRARDLSEWSFTAASRIIVES